MALLPAIPARFLCALRELGEADALSALEVCCGDGEASLCLAEAGVGRIIGVDAMGHPWPAHPRIMWAEQAISAFLDAAPRAHFDVLMGRFANLSADQWRAILDRLRPRLVYAVDGPQVEGGPPVLLDATLAEAFEEYRCDIEHPVVEIAGTALTLLEVVARRAP